jgi:GNAT superfamily N-acetyltransferase
MVGYNRPRAGEAGVCVKELTARDRRALHMHFLALEGSARLLRFGMVFPDELITRYVQEINFARDTMFGVYDSELMLAGVGHLAFTPREQALLVVARATSKERVGEFGISVSASARGMGIGTRLFERAAIHCRNADVDILYMQFLSRNESMIHIAKKFGMEVHNDHGEADAYLKLRPANPASASQEVVEEQAASLDYTLKLEARLRRLIEANLSVVDLHEKLRLSGDQVASPARNDELTAPPEPFHQRDLILFDPQPPHLGVRDRFESSNRERHATRQEDGQYGEAQCRRGLEVPACRHRRLLLPALSEVRAG